LTATARIRDLFGDFDPRAAGVIHVTSVWRRSDGVDAVMKICERTPRSATDRFVLDMTRAAADVIVMTGAILRAEPGLHCALHEDNAPSLMPWRRHVTGRDTPPWLVVLTGGHDLDLQHPALQGWARPVVFTSQDAAADLEGRAPAHVEIVGDPHPGIERLLSWARAERNATVVSIEAGPTTTRPLYDEPLRVGTLLLSVFEGPFVAPEVEGPPLLSPSALARRMPPVGQPRRIREPSGPWSFWRFAPR
jgi:hypothetical protein